MRAKRVYISGPFSKGDTLENIRVACEAWEDLRRAGLHPVCPHWSHTQQLISPISWQEWIDYDLAEVELCDAVLRLFGDSVGADAECQHAELRGIPVFYSIESLFTGGISQSWEPFDRVLVKDSGPKEYRIISVGGDSAILYGIDDQMVYHFLTADLRSPQ